MNLSTTNERPSLLLRQASLPCEVSTTTGTPAILAIGAAKKVEMNMCECTMSILSFFMKPRSLRTLSTCLHPDILTGSSLAPVLRSSSSIEEMSSSGQAREMSNSFRSRRSTSERTCSSTPALTVVLTKYRILILSLDPIGF